MNRPLNRAELRAISADLDSLFNADRPKRRKNSAPFSKREEGQRRRMERRQAIARKAAWLQE